MTRKTKKAQGLSINFVVVAAIALVVLIVIIYLFGSKLGLAGREISKCKLNAQCSYGAGCSPGTIDLGPCEPAPSQEGRCCINEGDFMKNRNYPLQ